MSSPGQPERSDDQLLGRAAEHDEQERSDFQPLRRPVEHDEQERSDFQPLRRAVEHDEQERSDFQPLRRAVEHYFSGTPTGPEHRRRLEVEVWGRSFALESASGVFAAEHLDRGTTVLLRESEPPTGNPAVLDLGCGYGPVALGIALACPGARVDAVDVNERALALCRDNAAALGVGNRVRCLLPDQVEAEQTYDEIWSNPPIRVGKQALHALLLTWLPRLRPSGTARLVVSKDLGADTLQRWLVEQGFGCERAASSKGFRVLVVTPRAA